MSNFLKDLHAIRMVEAERTQKNIKSATDSIDALEESIRHMQTTLETLKVHKSQLEAQATVIQDDLDSIEAEL